MWLEKMEGSQRLTEEFSGNSICLTSKRIFLKGNTLCTAEKVCFVRDLFFKKRPYKIHWQTWQKEDVELLFHTSTCLFLILNKPQLKSIGYISINKGVFEIVVEENYCQKGYSIEATLLLMHYYFSIFKPSSEYITTYIHFNNTHSLRTSLHFGWKINEITSINKEQWYELRFCRNLFFQTEFLTEIKKRYSIL